MDDIQAFNFGLQKDSTESQIKMYFERVLELQKSNEKFPINLDDVWPLVYSDKGKAVRALRDSFYEGDDYNLTQNGKVIESPQIQNGVTVLYWLSVPCMEFFIARKVRPVFEVYRKVFKKVTSGEVKVLPKDYATALRELASQVEENERLMLENKQKEEKIVEQAPKVVFADAIVGSKSSCLIGELAKYITQNGYKIGQNNLFEWMREHHYLGTTGEYYNIPMQRYIEQGLFELKTNMHSENGVMKKTVTPKVTGKGMMYFINIFRKMANPLFDDKVFLPED